MGTVRTTLKQWHARLGEPVPLNLVPFLLGLTPDQVRLAVRDGRLRVVTFKSDNRRTFRMVPRVDLRSMKNPITKHDLAAAFRKLSGE